MNLPEKFAAQLNEHTVPLRNHQFLLTVSGGVDSVVLCDLAHKANINFFIAHCNFQLRGEESERDESFVKELALKYGKEIFLQKFATETYAAENKVSIQVAARELRYAWLRQIVKQTTDHRPPTTAEKLTSHNSGLTTHHSPLTTHIVTTTDHRPQTTDTPHHSPLTTHIVTAHHADDNIETVVMNFFRGTGVKGLVGMDKFHEGIFRPLLNVRKHEIIEYAKENNLDFVQDSSNANSYYTRNYFRNELLPAISKVFPGVEENILKNIQRLKEVEQVYEEAIKSLKKKVVEVKGNEEHIPILKLQKLSSFRTILWEIIKEKGFTAAQVDEVIKLMNADNASYIESQTHRIIKNRKWLIIATKNTEEISRHIVINEPGKKIKFGGGELMFESNIPASVYSISGEKSIAAFDANEIEFPLLLRKWKQGDYFYPLGMKKKKKLSRFFSDQKLSPTEKENIWVIEMNKKILWLINHRIDDRFKITPKTKQVLKIILKAQKS